MMRTGVLTTVSQAWGLSFKAQRLSSQPKKDATLAQTFLWYQWDLMHQTLYVVYTRPQGKVRCRLHPQR